MSVWEELGIERTDNAREIKKAYAAKLKYVHPEEHPEKFQKLHEAYKLALNIAKYQSNMPTRQAATDMEKKEKPSFYKEEKPTDFDFSSVSKKKSPVAKKSEKAIEIDFKTENGKTDEIDVKEEKQFDFDAAIRRNTLKHDNDVMEKAEIVLKKAAQLYNKKLISNKQDWMDIFNSDSVEEIRYEPIFIRELCRFLRSHKITENIANAIFSSFKLYNHMFYYDNSEMEDLYNLIIGAKGETLNRLEAGIKLFKILIFLFSVAFICSFAATWLLGPVMLCLGGSIIGLIILKEKRKKFYE